MKKYRVREGSVADYGRVLLLGVIFWGALFWMAAGSYPV